MRREDDGWCWKGFFSLKSIRFKFQSLNQVKLTNLFELRIVNLLLETQIKSEVLLKLIENSPYVEILHLDGELSYLNLDSLYNLKSLDLTGTNNEWL
jgi:hypothetical protein